MPAVRKLDKNPMVAYFPEVTGLHTDLNLAIFFRIAELAIKEGLAGMLLAKVGAEAETWLPEAFWQHVSRIASKAMVSDALVAARPFTSIESGRYIHLSAEELLHFYERLQASSALPQLAETCEQNRWALWTTSATANRLKEFIIDSGLYLKDRSTRIVLISQHCGCRGKS